MATTIVTKSGSGAPTASDLVAGELAVDLTNGRLYTENSGGTVLELGLNPNGNVNVTGTVTADGLTVDGTTGISVNGSYAVADLMETDITDKNTRLITSGGEFRIDTLSDDKSSSTKRFEIDHATGDISFYEDTGTTPKLFWDASAESLGIGTSSPSTPLEVNVTGAGDVFKLTRDTGTNGGLNINFAGANANFDSGQGGYTFTTASSANAMHIDGGGKVGLGTTAPTDQLEINGGAAYPRIRLRSSVNTSRYMRIGMTDSTTSTIEANGTSTVINFLTAGSERMRIDSSGNLLVGKISSNLGTNGVELKDGATSYITNTDQSPLAVNREGTDGQLIGFYNDAVAAGAINVAGGTVSYTAFMGSHYSETTDTRILFGTVMEVTGELVDQNYAVQERLSKVKVSGTAESKNVYGTWIGGYDGGGETVAALGASWCRIASGVTLELGDLLVSNGDGTAKVQSDDIIRSMTIGKVTSVTVKETHTDGSYVVPVVLYCG